MSNVTDGPLIHSSIESLFSTTQAFLKLFDRIKSDVVNDPLTPGMPADAAEWLDKVTSPKRLAHVL